MRALFLATNCLSLLFASSLAAQEVDHSQMDHAHTEHAQAEHGQDGGPAMLRTPIPAITAADRLAAQPASMGHSMADDAIHSYTLVDRAEAWHEGAGTGLAWEATGWIGNDINRLWWRTEGEHVAGTTQAAELQALFGHSFSSRWDWVVGLRQELRPRESRSFAAIGVQGLAPQWFEVSLMAYAGEGGRTAAQLSAEYTLLLTNRLVLQPVVHVDLHGKDDPSRAIGSGLSTAEAGLRLRYEFTRQFAPYIGVAWERAFGDTTDLRRAAGDAVHDTRLVAGIRMWF